MSFQRDLWVAPLLCACLVAVSCGGSGAAVPNERTEVRGSRYCEVLAIQSDGGLRADVYNSLGLNECPQAAWDALDKESIQEDLDAVAVLLNGPRFFLMDTLSVVGEFNEMHTFGEIEMRLVASVVVPPGGLEQGDYVERSVNRDTEFTFLAGSEVYELFSPDDKVYVMQSYSHIVDDTLDENDLPHLGGLLDLPQGWAYQTRVVHEDYVVADREGVATVVQDEFTNTYQLARVGGDSP